MGKEWWAVSASKEPGWFATAKRLLQKTGSSGPKAQTAPRQGAIILCFAIPDRTCLSQLLAG